MGANDAQEMLVAAKAECVRLERENATLRADLDARFEHSDHLSAKYYRRMRDAERAGDELREQLAERDARDLRESEAGETPYDYQQRINRLEQRLAEAQATIEKLTAWADGEPFEVSDKRAGNAAKGIVDQAGGLAYMTGYQDAALHVSAILSAPPSTGGNDRPSDSPSTETYGLADKHTQQCIDLNHAGLICYGECIDAPRDAEGKR